jgi:hypothetical protein
MKIKWFAVSVALACITSAAAALAQNNQPQAGDKQPNIAVSGCLMRNGYATFMVADARVDGTGDNAAAAKPADKADPTTPARWILDNAGSVGTHVGEKVQVVGFSDWVADRGSAPPAPREPNGPPAPMPHIELQALKVLAPNC